MVYEFFEAFRRIRKDMERLIKELEEYAWGKPLADLREGYLEPLTQINETPTEIVISMDLPFVRGKEDIEVSVRGNEIFVEAEIDREVSFEDICAFYRGTSFRRYRKVIKLPENIDIEGIKAKFKSGILEIKIPKKGKSYRVKIE